MRTTAALAALLLIALPVRSDAPPCRPDSLAELACLSQCELEALYRTLPPAPMPCGYLRGRAFPCKGGALSNAIWHGKHFDPCSMTLVNQWATGKSVHARVYPGESLIDGGPSLIADYRGVSKVIWRDLRDEVREVRPGLYLGAGFRDRCGRGEFYMFFGLEKCE